MRSHSTSFVVFLLLASTALQVIQAGKTTFFNGKPGNQTALVAKRELILDLKPGNPADLNPDKQFNLTIGNCEMSIKAKSQQAAILYTIKDDAFLNPDRIKVSSTDIVFTAAGSDVYKMKYPVVFKELKGSSNYTINMTLEGEIPQHFSLSSDSATIYDGSTSGTENSDKDKGLELWKIIAIAVGGGLLLLLIIGSIVGLALFLYCRNKKRKHKQAYDDSQLMTAIDGDDVEEGVEKPEVHAGGLPVSESTVDKTPVKADEAKGKKKGSGKGEKSKIAEANMTVEFPDAVEKEAAQRIESKKASSVAEDESSENVNDPRVKKRLVPKRRFSKKEE